MLRWARIVATKGYNEKEVGNFVDTNGTITRVANIVFSEFVEFLDTDNNMSWHVLNKNLNWIQHVVRVQVEHFDCPEPKGHTRRLSKVKTILSKWRLYRNDHTHVSTAGVTQFVETHAKLEQDMTEEQVYQGVLLCLNKDYRLKIGPTHLKFII